MKRAISVLCVAFAASTTLSGGEPEQHVKKVADTEGLIAFWDFSLMDTADRASRDSLEAVLEGEGEACSTANDALRRSVSRIVD